MILLLQVCICSAAEEMTCSITVCSELEGAEFRLSRMPASMEQSFLTAGLKEDAGESVQPQIRRICSGKAEFRNLPPGCYQLEGEGRRENQVPVWFQHVTLELPGKDPVSGETVYQLVLYPKFSEGTGSVQSAVRSMDSPHEDEPVPLTSDLNLNQEGGVFLISVTTAIFSMKMLRDQTGRTPG